MTTILKIILVSFFLLLCGCKNEPRLQKYFVENTENKNFSSIDVTPKMLNIDSKKLSVAQKNALQSFEKINVLAFKINDANKKDFLTEKSKVALILKNKIYQQLFKFGSGTDGAQVSFVGTDENIEEFVIYVNRKENGFALIRVLGNQMNPTHIMNIMTSLQSANMNLDQLKPFLDQLK